MSLQALTQQTLAKMQEMILEGTNDGSLKKALDLSDGLKGINLESPAHQLVPLMSPFRQSIPRNTKPGSEAIQWKDIVSLGAPKLSVAERAAGQTFATTVTPQTAAYAIMALRGEVTRESQAQSLGFDDALAKETSNTLLNYMKLEEQYILGGNVTALATPTGLAVAEVNGPGTIGAVNNFVRVAALTLPAANRITVDRPADYGATTALNALLAGKAKTTPTPANDGMSAMAAEVTTGAFGGADNALKITWNAVPGAAAYAVFVGAVTGDANLKLECIVAQTSVSLTSLSGAGIAANDATVFDGSSADALSYDGIIPQLIASSGAYKQNVNGVMSGSSGEITAIQDMFQSIYDNAKLGKFRLVVGGIDSRILTRLGVSQNSLNIIANPAGSDGRASITFGAHVGQIMNSVTGDMVPVETAPWLAGGTILCLPTSVPYNDANISTPFDMVFGYDVERWDYASTTTTGPIYPFEVRSWGVLRGLFTGGCGIIYNIFKG